MTEDNKWHLDKKVPVAMIIAIIFQTGIFVWWMASLAERVNSLERTRDASAPQGDRITRVEVRLENVQAGIEEIKRLIRRDP